MGTPGLTLTANEVWGTEELVTEVGSYTMTDKPEKKLIKGNTLIFGKWKMVNGRSIVIFIILICHLLPQIMI
jgi:hypothetical protein